MIAHLKMNMRTGRTPGRSQLRNHLAAFDHLADLHIKFLCMTIAGRITITMIDLNHVPVAAILACICHDTARNGMHIFT